MSERASARGRKGATGGRKQCCVRARAAACHQAKRSNRTFSDGSLAWQQEPPIGGIAMITSRAKRARDERRTQARHSSLASAPGGEN